MVVHIVEQAAGQDHPDGRAILADPHRAGVGTLDQQEPVTRTEQPDRERPSTDRRPLRAVDARTGRRPRPPSSTCIRRSRRSCGLRWRQQRRYRAAAARWSSKSLSLRPSSSIAHPARAPARSETSPSTLDTSPAEAMRLPVGAARYLWPAQFSGRAGRAERPVNPTTAAAAACWMAIDQVGYAWQGLRAVR